MPTEPSWARHRDSLAVQAGLVRVYSPLTAALLEHAVSWLSDPDVAGRELGDPEGLRQLCERVVGLLEAGRPEGMDTGWIHDLDPSLRLNACLHWYVLQDDPRVVELRPYYKTVPEGEGPDARDPRDEAFGPSLFAAVKALGAELFERAKSWRVQTSETSRGLAWLLPATVLGVEAAHLIEFGCAAGLNLYAEQRRYDLAWSAKQRLRLGRADRHQFLLLCSGPLPGPLEDYGSGDRRGPEVLSRVGGDPHPVNLDEAGEDIRLEACIWGDQRRRLDRLREGIELHRHAKERGIERAEIRGLKMPEEVTDFLAAAVPAQPEAPVISFNTYVTAHLSDVNQRAAAREIRSFARRWTTRHKLPWMWVRFEPARPGQHVAPHPGWCRWVVEMFNGSWAHKVELGWAHPHMIRAEFSEGLSELRELGMREPPA